MEIDVWQQLEKYKEPLGGNQQLFEKKSFFLKPKTSSVNPVHNAQVCYFNNVHYARGSH